MSRYLVIQDADLTNDVKVLMRSDDTEGVENFMQTKPASEIKVYQLRYVAENVLCDVKYEGESDKLDTFPDVAAPAADNKVFVGGCATPEKWNEVISHPNPINWTPTINT